MVVAELYYTAGAISGVASGLFASIKPLITSHSNSKLSESPLAPISEAFEDAKEALDHHSVSSLTSSEAGDDTNGIQASPAPVATPNTATNTAAVAAIPKLDVDAVKKKKRNRSRKKPADQNEFTRKPKMSA